MTSPPEVRPYRTSDRAAVEEICFSTGYMGDPIAWQYPDRDSFAHLFCRWHIEHHPDCAWVVDVDGEARGYLIGCPDVRAGDPEEVWRTYFTHHVVRRGLGVRPGTGRWIWRSARDVARDRRAMGTPVDLDTHPADLHINLMPDLRGRGMGRLLMQRWFDDLTRRGVGGVHLSAYGENLGGRAFFESMGFATVGELVPMPGFRAPDGSRHTIRHMTRDLSW